MAIYIKGMDMPKNCEECFLVDSCDGKHWEITRDDMGYKGEYVKDNCPLTEVSEPHGRLIDADSLKTKVEAMVVHRVIESDYDFGGNQAFDYVADILIEDAPIIDAVEVVRCKDCKWYISQEPYDNCGKCTYRMREFLYCREGDFCSYGKRREESEVEE